VALNGICKKALLIMVTYAIFSVFNMEEFVVKAQDLKANATAEMSQHSLEEDTNLPNGDPDDSDGKMEDAEAVTADQKVVQNDQVPPMEDDEPTQDTSSLTGEEIEELEAKLHLNESDLLSNSTEDSDTDVPDIEDEVLVGPRTAVSDDFLETENDETKNWREELEKAYEDAHKENEDLENDDSVNPEYNPEE
jgi:hypothetical protein